MMMSLVLMSMVALPAVQACADHHPQAHKELNQILKKSGQELDLVKVLNDLKMSPVKAANDTEQLWRIDAVKKGSVFAKAGIKKGDIISIKSSEPLMMDAGTQYSETTETELE